MHFSPLSSQLVAFFRQDVRLTAPGYRDIEPSEKKIEYKTGLQGFPKSQRKYEKVFLYFATYDYWGDRFEISLAQTAYKIQLQPPQHTHTHTHT